MKILCMFVELRLKRYLKSHIMKKLILLPLLSLVFSITSHANKYETVLSSNKVEVISTQEQVANASMFTNYTFFIKLYHGDTMQSEARFFFMDGLTLGLDPGYDAGAFDQGTAISSRLPQGDQGVNFSLNAMSTESAFGQAVVLVINQNQGQSFRISASNNTLPENVNVYIEDTSKGTFTLLQDQDFELTPEQNLSGADRFKIHFTTEILEQGLLNTSNVFDTDKISIFKVNNQDFITIAGISPTASKTTATLFNMLGESVHAKTLNNLTQNQRISTQGLAKGIYVVQLKAGNTLFSKKVLIK